MNILRDSTYEKIEFSTPETLWLYFFNAFCKCFYEREYFKKFMCITER